mgnify:CR=1 FL=1
MTAAAGSSSVSTTRPIATLPSIFVHRFSATNGKSDQSVLRDGIEHEDDERFIVLQQLEGPLPSRGEDAQREDDQQEEHVPIERASLECSAPDVRSSALIVPPPATWRRCATRL